MSISTHLPCAICGVIIEDSGTMGLESGCSHIVTSINTYVHDKCIIDIADHIKNQRHLMSDSHDPL